MYRRESTSVRERSSSTISSRVFVNDARAGRSMIGRGVRVAVITIVSKSSITSSRSRSRASSPGAGAGRDVGNLSRFLGKCGGSKDQHEAENDPESRVGRDHDEPPFS